MWLYTLTATYHVDRPRGLLQITKVGRPDGPTVTRALCVIVVGVAKEGWVLIFARDGLWNAMPWSGSGAGCDTAVDKVMSRPFH